MNDPIRACIDAALSGTGAFVRVDRGPGLYATNLPAMCGQWQSIAAALNAHGITCTGRQTLLSLTPVFTWRDTWGAWALSQAAPSHLTADLMRHKDQPASPQELSCWIEGMKRLYAHDMGDFERTLRQTSAVALRLKCGGGLWVCGLCYDLMCKEGRCNT